MDKTRGFYPLDPGSIPGGGTNYSKETGLWAGAGSLALSTSKIGGGAVIESLSNIVA